MQKIDFKAILEPRNRGILLDLVVFLISVILMHVLTVLSLNLVRQAEEDNFAKLAVGLFFAGVFFLQPLGPILKRWSFHQRFEFENGSPAGCLLIGLMWFYVVLMILLSGTATIILTEALFERGSPAADFGALFIVGGAVLSFVNAFFIYRYFLKPKKQPRWKFLTTPRAALLGDVFMFSQRDLLADSVERRQCFRIFLGCSCFNSARRRVRNGDGDCGKIYCHRRAGFAGLFPGANLLSG